MTKLKTLLLGALTFSFAFALTGVAQNFVQRYDAYASGAPGFTLQAPGSYYGQIANTGSQTWGLSAGASQSVTGSTVAFKWGLYGAGFKSYTKANISLLTPDFIGEVVQCTDCTVPYTLCVASGTSVAQFSTTYSSSTGCGTGQ